MEKHKEKKKKDKKADKSNCVEQTEGIEEDARDVNKDNALGEVKVASKKRGKKKNRCFKNEDGHTFIHERGSDGQESRTDVEKDEEEVELDLRKDHKKEKNKKNKRNSEKEDGISSSSDFLHKGLDGMNDNDGKIGDKGTDKGQKRGENKKKEADEVCTDVQVNRKKKRKKDRSAKVGNFSESFETDATDEVTDDRQKRAGNVKKIEPARNANHEVGITMVEDVKKGNRKEDNYNEVSTSSLAAGINGSNNGKHAIADDKEPTCDEACKGSNGDKRKKRKRTKDGTGFEMAENDKRKRVKQALSAEDTKTADDGADGRPSTTLRSDKKIKRKKEKRDGENISLNLFSEGVSKNEMNAGFAEDKENEETSNMMGERRAGDSKASRSKEKNRRVRFSGTVEVFPPGNDTEHEEDGKMQLVQGKRFTPEEDKIIKAAVENYVEKYHLGKDGVHMILNYRSYRQVRNCWQEIGSCIPYRPRKSICYRAHVLLERSEERKWDPEDYQIIRRFHQKHGSKWKELAEQLGKHRIHVKDAWRRIKPPNLRKGCWSQDEYQTLFNLVNTDLRMKAFQEKKSMHGMLRDNISWEAISEKLATRSTPTVCEKWYNQLTSSLVKKGIWSDVDDYRLLDALQDADACCVEDVDWDNLLEHSYTQFDWVVPRHFYSGIEVYRGLEKFVENDGTK
ncbi:RNA polymerase I termination factor isoform X2 [Phoenix dactylifera]|uniref:RNA polymerase I termination factor isoform X2 n=1 Tax=Phoenix dactylifera TaxID=42345 RepID=A0A8B8ZMI5_PHODC|nr:RNA polymerase I termination factor isoform X2 [Phoenix dactylifera]